MEGICAIKEEFVVIRVRQQNSDKNDVSEQNDDKNEPPNKKSKASKLDTNVPSENGAQRKPKQRGQNKGRPKPIREAKENKPCPSILNVREGETPKPCNFAGCKYIHDPLEFIKMKPQDVSVNGGTCYMFNQKGDCPWGLSCRFGSNHLTPEGRNIVDTEKLSKYSNPLLNTVSYDLLSKLQKKKYDLSKAENMVISMKKSTSLTKGDKKTENDTEKTNVAVSNDISNKTDDTNELNSMKCISGSTTDEDIIPTISREKRNIDWKNKLYLGPLTTLGNLPFRRICKEFGADITCGEMALCDSLLKGLKQEWALVKKHESEDIFGVQICGSNPYCISKTALLLQEEVNVDFIDLNLGCPIDLVYKKGGGCGLLLRANSLETSIKCASQILTIPFTIKTRTGVYQDTNIAHQLAPKFSEWGVSMITIHGRSKEQRYTKFADWEYINRCALAAKPCPVYGNGDILTYDDYVKSLQRAPNVTGVMIGRGALIKPWIFTEIKEQKLWDVRSSERFDILKKFANYGFEHWGSDTQGVENTRRFLLEWLSFLHRYVPVGLLERPPQHINERPPYYKGRDDLETLMASPFSTDWIKLSEMLVGPVPEGFQFLPKHKANSYQ